MTEQPKPSTSNRIILVIMIALATILIGMTIMSTTNEWALMDTEPVLEEQAPAPAQNQ